MAKCEDCGCGMNGDICSNCHEELYIQTFQTEHMVTPVSKEFANAAQEQYEKVKENIETRLEKERRQKELSPVEDQ